MKKSNIKSQESIVHSKPSNCSKLLKESLNSTSNDRIVLAAQEAIENAQK